MQLTVQSDVLLAALQRVGPSVATSKRNTMLILEHVVIEADPGSITVAATNLDQSSHITVLNGRIGECGATLVPYKPFISYLKLVPKGVDIHIEREWRHETLALAFGESTATLRCLHAADYVNIPGVFDPAPYEKVRDSEKAVLAEEAGREAAQEQARKQAEHDRIAALPDRFVYRWNILYRTPQEMTFDTLMDAVRRWHDDYQGKNCESDGAVHHGYSITDKFGEVVVRNDDEMHRLYRELCVPHGPPPGIPCEPAGWVVAEENAIADVIGDIPVDFAPSVRVDVPLQQQEEMQHDSLAEKVERVRAAVVAIVPPKPAPRVTKLRFGYKPQTIERFFTNAIKRGAEIRYAFAIKHNGALEIGDPVEDRGDVFVINNAAGRLIEVSKASVKYLEYVG